jgi:preprotein translocase subunit SecG
MGGRGTANLLTRTTAVLAAIFMVLSLSLALLTRGTGGASRNSILDAVPASTSAPASKAVIAPVEPPKPTGPAVPTN